MNCHGMNIARAVGTQMALLLLLVLVVILSVPFMLPFLAWNAWKEEREVDLG